MKTFLVSFEGNYFRVILLFALLFLGTTLALPSWAQAATDDPSLYKIISYDYVAGLKFVNGLPDILHLHTYSIHYNRQTDLDIVAPPEVTGARAELFYIESDGGRVLEYIFFDDYYRIRPQHVWDKAGSYEVDVYGVIDSSVGTEYLVTMKFTVNMIGGPTPTCSFTATPSIIYPKLGETASLVWTSTNSDTAVIDQGIGSVATSDSIDVSPNATTTYTATFSGPNGSTDCVVTVNVPDPVVVPLHEQAAALARQLVNRPDAYLWGGKGWDYDLGEFTSPARILSGYTYFDPNSSSKKTGVGLDCSGLITWAFNRAYDATAGFAKNFVQYVNADGMYRDQQSDPVAEADIRPGDTITFDWDGDGRMDHVAMYVGESGGYDVVNAAAPDVGIEGQINNFYSTFTGFAGYRRIHQANVTLAVGTRSPVDVSVTDPDGNVLTATSTIFSDEEYIREVPGEMYYLELEQGHDGRPEDMVVSPIVKDGSYLIDVRPEPEAMPTDTYSLLVELNGVETLVVDNETIDTIPENGFTLKLSGGEIVGLDPTVKVLLSDLYQTLASLSISSAPRQKNLLSTTEAAISWFDKNRPDQIVRKLTKVQNDINRHLSNELSPTLLNDINAQIDQLLLLLNI